MNNFALLHCKKFRQDGKWIGIGWQIPHKTPVDGTVKRLSVIPSPLQNQRTQARERNTIA